MQRLLAVGRQGQATRRLAAGPQGFVGLALPYCCIELCSEWVGVGSKVTNLVLTCWQARPFLTWLAACLMLL